MRGELRLRLAMLRQAFSRRPSAERLVSLSFELDIQRYKQAERDLAALPDEMLTAEQKRERWRKQLLTDPVYSLGTWWPRPKSGTDAG